MKTIDIPAGYEFDSVSGRQIKLRDTRNVMDRIKSVEDALAELGEDDNEVIRYRKLLSVFDDPKDHLVNYQTAVVLVRAINEKRVPDWNNDDEFKYSHYFIMGGSSGFRLKIYVSWLSASHVGSRLCVFDPEHGEYLANQFPDIFKNFMLIEEKA